MNDDLYKPFLMRIESARDEAPDVRTFRLQSADEAERVEFFRRYRVGMFGLYGVPGEGESTFCVASPPTREGYIECTFRKTGRVTQALQDLETGQGLTFRGPYGNHFPLDEKIKGHNVVFIGMGIGLAPVRSVIWTCLDERAQYKDVTIIYGARSAELMVYKRELAEWAKMPGVKFVKTVDPGGNPPGWDGEVGFVPTIVEKAAPSPADAYAVLCGPPIGIKFTLPVLLKLGFPPERIYTTLENRMKCGLGKCGRCNVGGKYVCKEGPVFTAAEMKELPAEY